VLSLYKTATLVILTCYSFSCAMKQQNLLYKNVITDCIVIARQHVIFNNKPFVAFMYSNCYGYNKLGMVIWAVYGNHNKNIKSAKMTLYYFLQTHENETNEQLEPVLICMTRGIAKPPEGMEELGSKKIWASFFELREIK